MQQCKLNYAAQFLVSECVYHVFCENVQLGAVQPLGALLTAVQRFSPRHEDGTAHIPHAHGLLCKEGPWLTGLEDEHCVGHGRKHSNQEPLRNTANMKKKSSFGAKWMVHISSRKKTELIWVKYACSSSLTATTHCTGHCFSIGLSLARISTSAGILCTWAAAAVLEISMWPFHTCLQIH